MSAYYTGLIAGIKLAGSVVGPVVGVSLAFWLLSPKTPVPVPVVVPTKPPAHGTVYLLVESGKRAELGKYVGTPSAVSWQSLGPVSRWRDGAGHVMMTRAAVLFVEDAPVQTVGPKQ